MAFRKIVSCRCRVLVLATLLAGCQGAPDDGNAASADDETMPGFVGLHWDNKDGRLLVEIPGFNVPFLYQTSLSRGVGSNDLGLDRGQLGATRVVHFARSGPRVLLVEENLAYRATAGSEAERQAVAESFARSVIWGFEVVGETRNGVRVDATDFFLRDAYDVALRLKASGEGQYAVDAERSAIYLPGTRAFPDNTEVEAIVTFVGEPSGPYLPTVAPDARAISVNIHHSFVRLPDADYEPLLFDPRAGMFGLAVNEAGFADYATPIGEPLYVNFAGRHRLEKRDPEAESSEAVEPIIYYVDPATPEPVRSAIIDGARWWNQAFEAAGYKDAFQVRMLPADADPMDVRYNVIQWVHRATRGWSYGRRVLDPRTGEVIKGQVTLGSLRVRQDYLIIEGLLAPYAEDAVPETMLEVSLARIRQLSAHEVGHALGFVHNFAASTQGRGSVMDYPFPLVTLRADGTLDFSDAYAVGIGAWDKRAVLYAYQDFPEGTDRAAARAKILEETISLGFKYVTDADARAVSSAHPDGNLWDNGSDAIAELEHLLALRAHALARFSANNIRMGRPLARLEEVLVPVYLLHRFQIQAVGKLLGGAFFDYGLRGDGRDAVTPVSESRQREALAALLDTLEPDILLLPEALTRQILPRPPGHPRTRESFSGHTGVIFDPLAPAASAVSLTLDVLLDAERAARMLRNRAPGFEAVIDGLLERTWFAKDTDAAAAALRRQTSDILLTRLMQLATQPTADPQLRGLAVAAIDRIDAWLDRQPTTAPELGPHYARAALDIARWRADPSVLESFQPAAPPPGQPIGSLGD